MADMVTKQELEAAKIDVKHAGEAVNTKKVITPRYGAPFKSLPLVAAEAQAKADEVVAQGFYRGYTTEALLLAAKPAVAEMRARADDTRKIWRWTRTGAEGVTPVTGTWIDTGLSDLDQAVNYVDDFKKGMIISAGVNIFDSSSVEYGKYYDYQNGIKFDNPNFITSSLIAVESDTEYQVPNFYAQQFAYYDENRTYISGVSNLIFTQYKFTTPQNARYIGLTLISEWLDSMMLCKSSEFPASYKKYEVIVDNLSVNLDQIPNLKGEIDGVIEPLKIAYVNVLHDVELKSSSYVSYIDGNIEPTQGVYATDYCKILPNTEYRTSSNYDQQFAFYDQNKVFISGLNMLNNTSKTFVTPVNAVFARFTIPNALLDSLVISESNSFDLEDNSDENKLKLKTLLIDSDQITDIDQAFIDKLGLRSLNIIDESKATAGRYVNFTNGQLEQNADTHVSDFSEVKSNTEYKTSSHYTQQFAFYNESKEYISGMVRPNDLTKTFVTPANAKFIRLTIPNSQLGTLVVAEAEVFPDEYTPYSVKFADNIIANSAGGAPSGQEIGKPIEIWVSPDLSASTAFKGKNAIQQAINSIEDASAQKPYLIKADEGIFKVTAGAEFIGYLGYPSMIDMKNYVSLEGKGEQKTIIWAELPYDDSDIGVSANGVTYPRNSYQTIYNKAKEVTIKNLTFVAKNLRYTLHQDNPLGSNTKRYYENVSFIFKGNKGSLNSMGIGTSEGEETYVRGGSSISDNGYPIACHSNTAFKTPSLWSFNGHHFSNSFREQAILLQNCGSLVEDKFELIGCSFGGKSYEILYVTSWLSSKIGNNHDSFDHAGWRISGYGNEPFLFNNTVSGSSLRVRTESRGVGSTVRFGVNSSAYSLIIKNNHKNADASLYLDNREYVDGYIVQDGSVDYYAQAFGCKTLSDQTSLYDEGINYTSLSARLGDCSTNNKTLDVFVDGVLNTITFNKNYSAMTNAQILAEMNAQITGAIIDIIDYGRDYFPMITDVCEICYNTGSTFIPKGSVVTKSGGVVKLANGDDKVFGVALDDIPVQQTTDDGVNKGQGRVMKRGYISTHRDISPYVLADNYFAPVGTKFSIINGQLVTDPNGVLSVDIDDRAVSINC